VCAEAFRDAARELDIEVRAGVHTGECEFLGEEIAGWRCTSTHA
jgi:class 3 adenylate cyclase